MEYTYRQSLGPITITEKEWLSNQSLYKVNKFRHAYHNWVLECQINVAFSNKTWELGSEVFDSA